MDFIYKIFGWPLGWVMWLCYKITSNYGISLLIFTVIIQMVMIPITLKTRKSTAQQSALQPYTARLQQQYANNREKMAEEQQALYDATGVSMAGGCLMPLIQFPIIFGLMDVVYRPLTHIVRIPADVINAGIEIAKGLNSATTINSNQAELLLIPAVKNNKEAFSSLGADAISKIEAIDMTLFGIDLSLIPEKIFSVLGIFVIVSAVLSLLQIIVTQYISKKSNPNAPTMGAGMNIMMIAMGPVMSFIIGRSFPVGITLYWSIRYVVTIIQEILLDLISPQKKIVQKYTEEFDEKLKNSNKKKKKPKKVKVETADGKVVEKELSHKQYQSSKLAEARKRMDERYANATSETDDDDDEDENIEIDKQE